MLIGADCSVSTEPIAEIAHTWNLIQVASYMAIEYMYILHTWSYVTGCKSSHILF